MANSGRAKRSRCRRTGENSKSVGWSLLSSAGGLRRGRLDQDSPYPREAAAHYSGNGGLRDFYFRNAVAGPVKTQAGERIEQQCAGSGFGANVFLCLLVGHRSRWLGTQCSFPMVVGRPDRSSHHVPYHLEGRLERARRAKMCGLSMIRQYIAASASEATTD